MTRKYCKTCGLAEWPKSALGNFLRKYPGKCLYNGEQPPYPICLHGRHPSKSPIWRAYCEECPCWVPIGKKIVKKKIAKMELWPPEFRDAVSELCRAIYEYDDEYERRFGGECWERIRKARDEVVRILGR